MKNPKINRDLQQQKIFKDKLKDESRRIYGKEVCYATKKPYKGLVGSHIKSFKICKLEGDSASEFDINNGLLLSSTIDNYFDKYLISFDEQGKIILCEKIPEEIKEEFLDFSLDKSVYNNKRKENMRIHRSIFYYKNYCQNDPETVRQIHSVPYFDCGIKIYKDSLIANDNEIWNIISISHLKTEFVKRTKYKFPAVITSSELFSSMQKESEYFIDSIPDGFNCKTKTMNLSDLSYKETDNSFKISHCNFDPKHGTPDDFIKFLNDIFNNDDSVISMLRYALGEALYGEGSAHSIVFKGDECAISKLTDVLSGVLGSYIYQPANHKVFTGVDKNKYTIPNCRLLLVTGLRNKKLSEKDMIGLKKNEFFSSTVLNIDKYVPIYVNPNFVVNDSVVFEVNKTIGVYDTSTIIKNDGGKILWWLLKGRTTCEYVKKSINKKLISTDDGYIKKWMDNCCIFTKESTDKIKATDLYENYAEYCVDNNRKPESANGFGRKISKYLTKKRVAAGNYYLGIKLK